MRDGTERMGGWCFVLLIALSLPGPPAWADAGSGRADGLCEKAETAERDAREAERKSEERQRFLKGKGDVAPRNDPFQSGDAAATRQAVKAKIAQARAILPQLRQGAAASLQDRGVVPGLNQYFVQMEGNLSRTLQAADACLDAPEYCSVPSISCPPPPGMPVIGNVSSANLIRQVQQSYAQAANMAHQACLNLNGELLGEVERLKKESRAAGTKGELPGSAQAQRFGETDLYLRRAESLKREASQYRQEADRVSGVRGYCGVRSRSPIGAETAHAFVEAFKAAERRRKPAADFPPDAKVIDLKAEWERKWDKGTTLKASDVPLPKLSVGDGGETAPGRAEDTTEEDSPSWWDKTKSAYRKADEQVELTEFIKSRPKELLVDVVTEIIENSFGSFGRSITTGYKILSAVKTTSDEVGGILLDAPGVIAHGSASDAKELGERTDRVPLGFLNNLFDDVTGRFPPPRYRYQYKEGAEQ